MGLMAKSQVQNLLQRYEQLEKRDQIALTGLSVFFAGLLLYSLIWAPANEFMMQSKQNYARQLSLLQYLRGSEALARKAGQSGPAVSGQSLLSMVSASARKFDVKHNRLQPEGSDGVSVWFNSVGFNKLIQWLEDLVKQGFTVRQISIDREEEPGKVNARVILYH